MPQELLMHKMHQELIKRYPGCDFDPILSVLQRYLLPQSTVFTKTHIFSYISKGGFLISQIAFAKNGCFFTKDRNFSSFTLSKKLWKYDFQNLHSICFPTIYNTCYQLQNSGKEIFFTKKLVVERSMFPFLECCPITIFTLILILINSWTTVNILARFACLGGWNK